MACETYAVSLPDIEAYIGHKIPFANYDPDDLPEIVMPKARPRKPRGGPRRRPGGKDHNKHSKGQQRRPRRS
jgi:ATP-dependent RNA helicase RhlB